MKRRLLLAVPLALVAALSLSACDDVADGPCQPGYTFDEHDKECDPDVDHGYLMPYPLILWGSGSSAYYAPRPGTPIYKVRPGYSAPKGAPAPIKAAQPKPPSSFGGSSSSFKGSSSSGYRAPAPAPRPAPVVRVGR